MNKTILIALAVALVTPLAAFADQTTLGIPDITCQDSDAWRTHDYGAPATGSLLFGPQDGNLQDCNPPYTYGWFLLGDEECTELLAAVGGDVNHPLYVLLCRTDRTADWDGDLEFAHGGAYLVSRSGADATGAGGVACFDILGHHPQNNWVTVTDASSLPVAFTVTADVSATPPLTGPDCGDNVIRPCNPNPPGDSTLPQPVGGVVDTVNDLLYTVFGPGGGVCTPGDVSEPCLNTCLVDFPAGADGAYIVFVGPSLAGNNGEPTGATVGHVYL